MSLIDIEKKVLMTYSSFLGLRSKRILNNLGIDTSYSNSLKGKINNLNIDEYINHSTSTFKNTLLKIKKKYLS